MFKKIFSLLIAAAVILPQSVPAKAKISVDSGGQIIEILAALDIIDKEAEGEKVTREEFFESVLHMLMDSSEINSVKDQAAAEGLIISASDSDFGGALYISYNDAVEAAVKALGYDRQALMLGGYPSGYHAAAAGLGIVSGVFGDRTAPMTRENVYRLLFNMLFAEPMALVYGGDGETLEVMKGETILSQNRDIYEIEGLVTANSHTSLYDSDGNPDGSITIDSEDYFAGDSGADSMLGIYSVAYVCLENKSGNGTVLYIAPKHGKNYELSIEADDIESVDDGCSYIEYIPDEASRSKTAKLDKALKVIYNGKFFGGYTSGDFMPEAGSVRLVDNTGDGLFDAAFISSYETVVVDYTSLSDMTVHNKYVYDGVLKELCLDPDETDGEINIYYNEENGDFYDIKEGSVLSVMRTKNSGKGIISVYISENRKNGKLTSQRPEDKEIAADGEIYPASGELYHNLDALGETLDFDFYEFSFDIFGRVVYAKKTVSTDYSLFYKIYMLDGEEDGYGITFMNSDSEWKDLKLADKVRLNGERKDAGAAYSELELFEPQIMKIKTNAGQEITDIRYAVIGSYKTADFVRTAEQKMTYRSDPKSFNCTIYPSDEAKIFVLPSSKSTNKDDYYITSMSYFSGDTEYTIVAYDMDEYNFANVITVAESQDSKKKSVNQSLFVVTQIGEKYENDEVLPYLKGSMGKYVNIEMTVKDSSVISGIKPGDVLNIHVDQENRVDVANVVYTIEDEFKGQSPSELYMRSAIIAGKVSAVDFSGKRMRVSSDRELYFRLNASAGVVIYNRAKNRCEAGAASDISVNDNIIIRTRWGAPQEYIVVRSR